MALVIVKLHESDHSSLDSPSEEEVYISLYYVSAVPAVIWEQFFVCVHQGGVNKETATHWPQKLPGNFLEPWAACMAVQSSLSWFLWFSCVHLLLMHHLCQRVSKHRPALKQPTHVLKVSAEEQRVDGRSLYFCCFCSTCHVDAKEYTLINCQVSSFCSQQVHFKVKGRAAAAHETKSQRPCWCPLENKA